MSIRHDRDLRYGKSRNRKPRPKTFTSEEAAHKYAKEQGLENYTLQNIKHKDSKKAKIRIKQ